MTDPYDPYRAADNPQSSPQPPPSPLPPPSAPAYPAPVDPYAPPVPSAPPTINYSAVPPVPSAPPTMVYPPVSASPVPYAPQPAAYVVGMPYGVSVVSDKSKVTAGLLQLVLGFVFTLGGVGRLYAGHTAVGVIQIVASVVAWSAFWCGFVTFFFSWPLWIGAWLWFVIDGIVLLAGRPVDAQGRPLRS